MKADQTMCGRFTQRYTWSEVHAFLSVIGAAKNLRPRYNIAPTTTIDVIRLAEGGRELVSMRWGLVPVWWKKGLKDVPATFNARAETVAEKPMFRTAFKKHRCPIPASGFYEWTGGKGVPLRRGTRDCRLRFPARRDGGQSVGGLARGCPDQAAASRSAAAAGTGFQFHGSRSARRWAGWDAIRPSTSASQA